MEQFESRSYAVPSILDEIGIGAGRHVSDCDDAPYIEKITVRRSAS